jgi:hypothetical protein
MTVADVLDDILHISEQPWSSFTEADYTIEQWHAACLIHLHDGPPTSKSQCKLPVKTPNGVLNRNGVHAAAAALAGARSPLKASPEQKASAANSLRRYYSQLGETPPDSLSHNDHTALGDIVLAHHGVKGMRWGHRKEVHPDIADVPKKTRKLAAKDAEEFTRAKLYFGEGAGVRRRLIKAKVEATKKRDPAYAKAFDHFVKQTDLAQRAHQARKQRKRTDRGKALKRNLRVASNILLEQSDMSMGDIVLEHHGVKGMRWGHRQASTQTSGPSRRERRANQKFEKKASSIDTKIALNNAVTGVMNKHIEKINAEFNSKYAKEIDHGVLLDRDNPITKRYHKAYNDAAIAELNNVASKMTNKSGTKMYKVAKNPDDFLGFTVITVDVKHADDLNSVRFVYIKDSKGRIVGMKIVDNSAAQSGMGDIVLTHHGVKGMRWGIRRKATVGPQEVIVSNTRRKLRTSGGAGHPASSEAVSARTTGQIAKKSGVHSLSNAQLRAYNERLNLEQNFKRLNFQDKSAGQRFVQTLMGKGISSATKAGGKAGGKALINSPKSKRVMSKGAKAVAFALA